MIVICVPILLNYALNWNRFDGFCFADAANGLATIHFGSMYVRLHSTEMMRSSRAQNEKSPTESPNTCYITSHYTCNRIWISADNKMVFGHCKCELFCCHVTCTYALNDIDADPKLRCGDKSDIKLPNFSLIKFRNAFFLSRSVRPSIENKIKNFLIQSTWKIKIYAIRELF